MKKIQLLSLCLLAAFAIVVSSCKSDKTSTGGGGGGGIVPPPTNAVPDTYAGGIINGGTFLSGHTYNITKGNIIVNGGTVTFQAGAKILFGGKPQIITLGYQHHHNGINTNINLIKANIAARMKSRNLIQAAAAAPAQGDSLIFSLYLINKASLVCQGTKDSHVIFTTATTSPTWPNGYWGGINCDSTTQSVNMQWTDLSYTGGADSISQNQYAFFIDGKPTTTANVIIENSSFQYGVDDCTRLGGSIKLSIKGNIFKKEGSNDGDGINIKTGPTGDVAYNYCWSGANNSIKLNADPALLTAVTNINIYNNTIINGGWRKVGEASAGILVDAFAKGTVYNNLIMNCREGLRITSASDTLFMKGKFGYNYIYAVVDSSAILAFGAGEWGKQQSTDIVSLKGGDKNPLITAFDPTTLGDASLTDKNDPHLTSASPAIGKGNTNATFTAGLGTTAGFAPGKDIGAYQTDGTGNQRIN